MGGGGGKRGKGGGSYPLLALEFPYRIRILMYRDVSCMYPEGYTYLECILMYLKCILHALLHSKRIHVSWFLDASWCWHGLIVSDKYLRAKCFK